MLERVKEEMSNVKKVKISLMNRKNIKSRKEEIGKIKK